MFASSLRSGTLTHQRCIRAWACALLPWLAAHAAPANAAGPEPVVRQYATIVQLSYEDALRGAQQLQLTVDALVQAPTEEGLEAARQAWLKARETYGRTEAFRFYGGPIDSEDGPEGRINAWPMDESYVDSVKGKPVSGLIHKRSFKITRAAISMANERGGEENIATGWHAIEFLLWGQDFYADGPGRREVQDFVDGKAPNADRRRAYLRVVTDLLVDDLARVAKAWAPGQKNYRARFEQGGRESLRKMLIGMGSLSRGELAGERMEVALASQDQEDEHSCFSDNTHRDIVSNAKGIQNVWLGRHVSTDGAQTQGPSLKDLVAETNAALAERLTLQIAQSVRFAEEIQAPFDQEIIGGQDAPGRLRVQATVDSLVEQSKQIVAAADAIGIRRLTLVKP